MAVKVPAGSEVLEADHFLVQHGASHVRCTVATSHPPQVVVVGAVKDGDLLLTSATVMTVRLPQEAGAIRSLSAFSQPRVFDVEGHHLPEARSRNASLSFGQRLSFPGARRLLKRLQRPSVFH